MSSSHNVKNSPQTSRWTHPVLLVNSGSRRGSETLDHAETALKALGLPLVAAELTTGETLRDRLSHHRDAGADLLIVGGGDGTLRLAAEELRDGSVPMGILPMGTGNNFARDLCIPLDLEEACQAIAGGEMLEVDLGEVVFNDGKRRLFINAIHIGLLGEVNPRIDKKLKRQFGYLAYVIGAKDAIRDFHPFQLCATVGRKTQCWTIVQASAVMGQVYAGGVGYIPGEGVADSHMTLTMLEKDNAVSLLTTVLRMARAKDAAPVKAHRIWSSEVYVETDSPQDLNMDGELEGKTPVTLRVLPKSLRVVVGSGSDLDLTPPRSKVWLYAGIAAGAAAGGVFLWRRRSSQPGQRGERQDEDETGDR